MDYKAFICPYCGKEMRPPISDMCPYCGNLFDAAHQPQYTCPNCNTKIDGKPHFCPNCGLKLN